MDTYVPLRKRGMVFLCRGFVALVLGILPIPLNASMPDPILRNVLVIAVYFQLVCEDRQVISEISTEETRNSIIEYLLAEFAAAKIRTQVVDGYTFKRPAEIPSELIVQAYFRVDLQRLQDIGNPPSLIGAASLVFQREGTAAPAGEPAVMFITDDSMSALNSNVRGAILRKAKVSVVDSILTWQ